jgi:hypothetical protein
LEQGYREVAMPWEKWINRHTRLTSLGLGNNRPCNRLLKKMDLPLSIRKILIEQIRHSLLINNVYGSY